MAWVEKDHNAHLVSTPCYVQGCQPPDRAAQSHSQPGLERLQGWGIHAHPSSRLLAEIPKLRDYVRRFYVKQKRNVLMDHTMEAITIFSLIRNLRANEHAQVCPERL